MNMIVVVIIIAIITAEKQYQNHVSRHAMKLIVPNFGHQIWPTHIIGIVVAFATRG